MLSLVLSCAGRFYRCEGAVLPLERYCRYTGAVLPLMWLSVLPPITTVLPLRGRARGLSRGQGWFPPPIPICFVPSFLFLSPAPSRRGRAPAALRLRTVSFHFLRWSRSPPRPLAMDAGIAPVPLLFLSSFQISCFRGNSGCISRFLAKSRLE